MKSTLRQILIFFVLYYSPTFLFAQVDNLTNSFKESTVKELSQLMVDYYVFPEKAKLVEEDLSTKLDEEYFNEYNTLTTFAEALTHCIYTICKDKHIVVNPVIARAGKAEEERSENDIWVDRKLERRTSLRQYNANFKTVEKLNGNVGYLDFRGFYPLDMAKPFADKSLALLSVSDALIIDLRNNQGGRADMVTYLCSYFFDSEVILSKSQKRKGDTFVYSESHSLDKVGGKKLPDVPLFILTSNKTVSAAEAFSYPLKIYNRATFVGETTAGGANAGDIIRINERLEVFIPDVAGINPITNTNWEGVGIVPDVKTTYEEAFDVAYELALKAAKEFKLKQDEEVKDILVHLKKVLDNPNDDSISTLIINSFIACENANIIFEEWELIRMGYNFLLQNNKPKAAEAIFEVTTMFYPESANAFDSYGEALLKNKKWDKALFNYEKAVSLGKKNNDPDVNLYIENLEKAKNQIKSKD